jgi:hypothetical protein
VGDVSASEVIALLCSAAVICVAAIWMGYTIEAALMCCSVLFSVYIWLRIFGAGLMRLVVYCCLPFRLVKLRRVLVNSLAALIQITVYVTGYCSRIWRDALAKSK